MRIRVRGGELSSRRGELVVSGETCGLEFWGKTFPVPTGAMTAQMKHDNRAKVDALVFLRHDIAK